MRSSTGSLRTLMSLWLLAGCLLAGKQDAKRDRKPTDVPNAKRLRAQPPSEPRTEVTQVVVQDVHNSPVIGYG